MILKKEKGLGKVSVAIDEDDGLTVIYSKDFMEDQDEMTREAWYDFLKELRIFSKKRMLDYSVRDITKSNLNKRDYKFLAKTPRRYYNGEYNVRNKQN